MESPAECVALNAEVDPPVGVAGPASPKRRVRVCTSGVRGVEGVNAQSPVLGGTNELRVSRKAGLGTLSSRQRVLRCPLDSAAI